MAEDSSRAELKQHRDQELRSVLERRKVALNGKVAAFGENPGVGALTPILWLQKTELQLQGKEIVDLTPQQELQAVNMTKSWFTDKQKPFPPEANEWFEKATAFWQAAIHKQVKK